MTTAQGTSGDAPPAAPGGSRRAVFAISLICAAQFVLQLDFSVVNVALPSIQRSWGCPPRSCSGSSPGTRWRSVRSFTSLYLQKVLGFSPVATGLTLVPSTVTVVLVSTLGTRRPLMELTRAALRALTASDGVPAWTENRAELPEPVRGD